MPNSSSTVPAAEYAFLGCLFDYDAESPAVAFSKAFGLGAKKDWFTDDRCRLVWAAIEKLWTNGGMGDTTLLDVILTAQSIARSGDQRKGSDDDDFSAVQIDETFIDEAARYVRRGETELSGYADILRNACTGRKILNLCQEMAKSLGTSNASVCADLSRKASEIIASETVSKEVNIRELNEKIVQGYENAYEEVQVKGNVDYTPGLKLPWRKMNLLYNGFNVGLHIIGARPSVGKTSFALQLMRFWCDQGYRVLFNGLDMSSLEALKRPIAERSRISSRQAQFGKASKDDIERIRKSAEKTSQLYDSGLFSMITEYDVHAFKAHCARRAAANSLDIVVVDFLQCMRYNGSERLSDVQVITHVSHVLKSISNELGIHVVALSQLSRDNVKGEGRTPEISDLRGSGAIEQDATTVALLYKDDGVASIWEKEPPMQYAPSQYPPSCRPIWVDLKKNQNGDIGRIPFVSFLPTFSWYLGDYKAESGSGPGANLPKFAKVHDDWRHDGIEDVFERNDALVRTDVERQLEQFNSGRSNQTVPKAEPASPPKEETEQFQDDGHVDMISALDAGLF